MRYLTLALAFAAALSCSAHAQFSLANYRLEQTISLVLPGNTEASGITYNQDNGRLYIVEDEGTTMYELNTSGVVLSTMSMTGFADTEGITYIGGGQFLIVEERLQDVFKFTYSAGGSLNRSTLPGFSFGGTVGNIGLEGVSYDPVGGFVFGVKEKTPQLIYKASINFSDMTGTVTSFEPSLGVLDLADVQALSTVSSLGATSSRDNLLVFSQESAKLVEITRDGTLKSEFDFAGLSTTAEGVTIAPDGTIFVTSEDPKLFILRPVPEPTSAVLLLISAGLFGTFLRRRATAI